MKSTPERRGRPFSRAAACILTMAPGLLAIAGSGGLLVAQTVRPLSAEHQRQVRELQPRIDAAIDKGVGWLLRVQQRDGSWAHEAAHFPTGMTALACYTLLKAGLPPSHPAIQRAISNLESQRPDKVYAAACNLLALAATHDPAHRAHMKLIVDDLLSWQNGTWGYPNPNGEIGYLHGDRDLSITQFAVLGFRAAASAGITIPKKAWVQAFEGILDYQDKPRTVKKQGGKGTSSSKQEVAGFRYRYSTRGKSTGSMTTAGIAAATIVAEGLGKRLTARQRRLLGQLQARGLGWLDHHFTVEKNPNHEAWWHYYYLYGLERVGSLLQSEYIGEHPWYLEGARFLVGKQQKKGSWYTSRTPADTCFAILFLERATAATTGKTRKPARLTISEDPKSPVGLRAIGGKDGTPLEMWVTRIGTGKDGDPDARVVKVEYLVGKEVVAVVAGEKGKAWKGQSFACRHTFAKAGKYHVGARVHVLVEPPQGGGAEDRVWTAKGFDLEVRQILEPWMLEATTIQTRNLLSKVDLHTAASSQAKNHGARNAVDGLQGTSWRFEPGHERPSLFIQLSKPQRADTLSLSQAAAAREHLGKLARILRVNVYLNRSSKPMEVTLDPDELEPTTIPLGRSLRIKRIRIEVLATAPGSNKVQSGGFAEVVLLHEKEKRR